MATLDLIVLGAAGQVGSALLTVASPLGLAVHGLTRQDLDITEPEAVVGALRDARPAVVVNAAAFTDVDGAEDAAETALAVNRDGAAHVAQACANVGAALIHISTDYVFSGAVGRPWLPDDVPRPLNAYGRSKLAGEAAVRAALPQAAIVRTARVFSPWGKNFLCTLLRRLETRSPFRVVDDQIGGPTSAIDLACALCRAAPQVRRGVGGTHHFCGGPAVSWFGFARAVLAAEGVPACLVEAIPSREWPTRATRPAYSMLDTTSFETAYGYRPRDWHTCLLEVMKRLRADRRDFTAARC